MLPINLTSSIVWCLHSLVTTTVLHGTSLGVSSCEHGASLQERCSELQWVRTWKRKTLKFIFINLGLKLSICSAYEGSHGVWEPAQCCASQSYGNTVSNHITVVEGISKYRLQASALPNYSNYENVTRFYFNGLGENTYIAISKIVS